MRPPTVSVVIPAFNEERRLPQLIETLARSAERDLAAAGLELLEAIVVDDGSTDRTDEVLRREVPGNPLLRSVLIGPPNHGKGRAVARGVSEARGELVLFADVDLSIPLSEAAKLAELLRSGAEVAIGSKSLDRSLVRTSSRRVYMGRAFNLFVRPLSGLPFGDTQCGFKLMRTQVARELLEHQISEGFAFDVELLMRARMRGLRIAEAAVICIHDDDSRVGVVGAPAQMLRDLVRLAYRLRVRGEWSAGRRQVPPPPDARGTTLDTPADAFVAGRGE